MKKLRTILIVVSVMAIMASCSKPDQHLNTIPVSSQVVGSIDLMSFAKKAELYDMEQYTFYVEAMKEFKENNPQMHAVVQDIISNPLSTGLRYREDMFFFIENSQSNPFMGLTMSIRSADDFDKFIKEVTAASEGIDKVNLKEGLNYIYNQNGMLIIYDKQKMLNVVKDGAQEDELFEYAKSLMLQDAETSIVSHSDWSNFSKEKKDMNLWIATGKFSQTPQAAMLTSQLPFKTDNIFAHIYIDFKDDGIYGSSKTIFNDEIQQMLDDYQFMKPGFDTKLLTYLPEENYISTGFAINPEAIYKWANDIPSYKKAIENVGKSSPLSFEKFVKSLGGDIIIAVHGINIPEDPITTEPSKNQTITANATAILSMNDAETYNQLTQLIPQELFEKKDGFYSGNFKGVDVLFGLFDNNLIVTTDKMIIDGAQNGGLDKNLADTDLKNLFSNKTFMYMNLDQATYPENIKKMLAQNMDKKGLEVFNAITDITKEARAYGEKVGLGKFEFQMKNTDGNSLHTILKLIDKINQIDKKSQKLADTGR